MAERCNILEADTKQVLEVSDRSSCFVLLHIGTTTLGQTHRNNNIGSDRPTFSSQEWPTMDTGEIH